MTDYELEELEEKEKNAYYLELCEAFSYTAEIPSFDELYAELEELAAALS